MNREAIPTEFAVVSVETERLRRGRHRRQADVSIAVLPRFTITLEIDGTHVAKEVLAQIGLSLSGLLHQSGIHHKAILTEDCVHAKGAQRSPALFKRCSSAGDTVAAVANLEATLFPSLIELSRAGGGIGSIQLNANAVFGGPSVPGKRA